MKNIFIIRIISICMAFSIMSCDGNEVDLKEIIGKNVKIESEYYHDYGGISPHGELFDFKEYTINKSDIYNVVGSERFSKLPSFSAYKDFYKEKLKNVSIGHWRKTPITTDDNVYFNKIFIFNNLLEDNKSRKLVESKCIHSAGNYYSYFSAYPSGTDLYILVPSEGKLYIIRKQ